MSCPACALPQEDLPRRDQLLRACMHALLALEKVPGKESSFSDAASHVNVHCAPEDFFALESLFSAGMLREHLASRHWTLEIYPVTWENFRGQVRLQRGMCQGTGYLSDLPEGLQEIYQGLRESGLSHEDAYEAAPRI